MFLLDGVTWQATRDKDLFSLGTASTRVCALKESTLGKPSRRANRRNRVIKRSKVEARQHEGGLKVTVFTSPSVKDGEISLTEELRLVRSALLYADTVELVSPAVTMLGTFGGLQQARQVDPLHLLSQLDDEVLTHMGGQNPDKLRAGLSALHRMMQLPEGLRNQLLPEKVRRESDELLANLTSALTDVEASVTTILKNSGSPELELALTEGALTVHHADITWDTPTEDQIAWFAERLRNTLKDPSGTLLLDAITTRFLRDLPGAEVTDSFVMDQATRAASGTGLLERLPTFPDAAMQDVLEVRNELAEGRKHYRRAVKHLSRELTSTALEDSLPREIDEVWNDQVRPALKNMQDAVTASRLGRGLAQRLISDYKSYLTGSGLIVAVENIADLSPATAAVAIGTNVAWQAAAEVLQTRSEVRKRDLVYLLDAQKRLGDSRS